MDEECEDILLYCDSVGLIRYIAKTLYGNEEPNEEEEEDVSNPKSRINMDEPKLIGVYPGSDEKVGSWPLF